MSSSLTIPTMLCSWVRLPFPSGLAGCGHKGRRSSLKGPVGHGQQGSQTREGRKSLGKGSQGVKRARRPWQEEATVPVASPRPQLGQGGLCSGLLGMRSPVRFSYRQSSTKVPSTFTDPVGHKILLIPADLVLASGCLWTLISSFL